MTTTTTAPATAEVRRFGAVWTTDALARDIDIGAVVRETDTYIWLAQTEAQTAEMRSAADYDIDCYRIGATDMRGLAEAAGRVIGALNRPPQRSIDTADLPPVEPQEVIDPLTAAQDRLRRAEQLAADPGSTPAWIVEAELRSATAAVDDLTGRTRRPPSCGRCFTAHWPDDLAAAGYICQAAAASTTG